MRVQTRELMNMNQNQEEEMLSLHGHWASIFCTMVELALKLKGVPYHYKQEDLVNKSEDLIRLNPVYAKVPLLVINGDQPLAESLVILEYIEEMWKDREPTLLPPDPYTRARFRFWADFLQQKVASTGRAANLLQGEELEKKAAELKQHVRTLELGLKEDFTSNNINDADEMARTTSTTVITFTLLSGERERPNLLDIVVLSYCLGLKVFGGVIGEEFVNKRETPFLWSHLETMVGLDVVKETVPDFGRLVEFASAMRDALIMAHPPK